VTFEIQRRQKAEKENVSSVFDHFDYIDLFLITATHNQRGYNVLEQTLPLLFRDMNFCKKISQSHFVGEREESLTPKANAFHFRETDLHTKTMWQVA
jgi:hypothetical protein